MAQLTSVRETRFNFIARDKAPGLTESPTQVKVRFDNWRKVEHYEMVNEFTGITIFRSLGDYPDQITGMEPSSDVHKPVGLKVPREPSESERTQHELTHMPYAPWCQSCVHGKGSQTCIRLRGHHCLWSRWTSRFPSSPLQGVTW